MSIHMASKLDRIKPFIAILATAALAACALPYISHLDTTGAEAVSGFFATLRAASAACSLQDALLAAPFGLLMCLEPSPIREHPKSVSLLAFMLALITILSAAIAQTHHLVSLCADLPHAIISLLSFALIWLYLFYVFRFVFRILPPLAAKLFTATCTSPRVKIFLVSFAVLLLAWSPYVICFAPARIVGTWDRRSLNS